MNEKGAGVLYCMQFHNNIMLKIEHTTCEALNVLGLHIYIWKEESTSIQQQLIHHATLCSSAMPYVLLLFCTIVKVRIPLTMLSFRELSAN